MSVRTHTVEKPETSPKGILRYVRYGDKMTSHGCGYVDITDQHHKLAVSLQPGVEIVRHRDLIRFRLYLNSDGVYKTMQNFDLGVRPHV